jgi:two-component system sensor histidine kinase VicK
MDAPQSLGSASYDSDRLIQVLTNLVSNAIKFTPEGGSINVSARRQGESLAFCVRDTGLGIPKDDLPKIFNRFYRVHRPGQEIKGTGLGLAIVHKIVAAHGGRIDVQSEVDHGTTFTVQLPLDAARSDDAGSRQADEQLEVALLPAHDRRAT